MEIQQHDGVVVEAAGISAGLRQAQREGDLPPKSSGALPTPRVSNPRRRGRPKGGAPAHQGLV